MNLKKAHAKAGAFFVLISNEIGRDSQAWHERNAVLLPA